MKNTGWWFDDLYIALEKFCSMGMGMGTRTVGVGMGAKSVGMGKGTTGTVGDGDELLSPCSSLVYSPRYSRGGRQGRRLPSSPTFPVKWGDTEPKSFLLTTSFTSLHVIAHRRLLCVTDFYRTTRMHRAAMLWQDVCLSIRLSVTWRYSV